MYFYQCGLFSHDASVLNVIRSPGEQVQYKACAGHYCCASSGLLHHTGNDRGQGFKKIILNNVLDSVGYVMRTTKG